jgi:hypothetical protein
VQSLRDAGGLTVADVVADAMAAGAMADQELLSLLSA